MKRVISKTRLAATVISFFCFLNVNLGNVAFADTAQQTTVAVNVQIQQNLKNVIDQLDILITSVASELRLKNSILIHGDTAVKISCPLPYLLY